MWFRACQPYKLEPTEGMFVKYYLRTGGWTVMMWRMSLDGLKTELQRFWEMSIEPTMCAEDRQKIEET